MYPLESPYAACIPYQRFDNVDGRLRPMRVIVYGSAQQAVIECDNPIECDEDLRARLNLQGISDDVVRYIRCVIARDNYAPKCHKLIGEDITVFVEYADASQKANSVTANYPDTVHVSNIGFGAGSNSAWRAAS
jgi:hypothetical protein